MSSTTIYTSTITVPVYASWKCEECGEVNFATGTIVYKHQESTGSLLPSKQRETEEKAASLAQAEWVEKAYQIISDPNNHAQDMRNNLFLQNTHCKKCGKKPKWDKDMKYLSIGILCFLTVIISGIISIAMLTNLLSWLLFIFSLTMTVAVFADESHYKNTVQNLPKEYTPVIGTLNVKLINYAAYLGQKIPSPDECIAIVKSYRQIKSDSTPKYQHVIDSVEPINSFTASDFCRKCGARLQSDSVFCHKCGTKI